MITNSRLSPLHRFLPLLLIVSSSLLLHSKVNAETLIEIPLSGVVTPSWFTETRIHAHTRLSPLAWTRIAGDDPLEKFLFDKGDAWVEAYDGAEAALSKMGVSVYTRHGKTMNEDPPWPSSTPWNSEGTVLNKNTTDQISPIVARARAEGLHPLIYYWDSSDQSARSLNPDWTCKDKHGNVIGHAVKGPHLDISSGYKKVVATRLNELYEMGVSGIYLDWRHFPPSGCFGTEMEQRFRVEHPELADTPVRSAIFWQEFQLYQAKTMAETINGWVEPFRKQSDFAILVSVTSLPTLINREMTYDLARAGIPKTEYHIATRRGLTNYLFQYNPDLLVRAPTAETRMTFGWSMLRSVSQSSPHVWINGVPTIEQLMLAAGAVVSTGGILNLDIDERNITRSTNNDGVTPRNVLEKMYRLNDRLGPLFKNAEPLKYVAIHFSEKERNKYGQRGAWVNVIEPVLKIYESLVAAGIPVVGIDDRMLIEGDLSPYQFVISTATPTEADNNLNKHGVALTHIPPPGLLVFNRNKYYRNQLSTVIEKYNDDPATIKIEHSDQDDYIVTWEDKSKDRILVSIVKPFSQVQTGSNALPASKPYFSLPAKERVDSRLKVKTSRFDKKPYCASDGLTGVSLEMDNAEIHIPGPSAWRVVEIKPCVI